MSQLVLISDTLAATPATGTLEYNGQFYGTDSAASRAQMQRITQGTAVASTSGTSIDFTSIPSWVKRITVMFSGVSTSGTSNPLVQVGAGSVTTTGYAGTGASLLSTPSGSLFTNGFGIVGASAANVYQGQLTLTTLGSNVWTCSYVLPLSSSAQICFGGGTITLSGTLDRVRVTTVGGTDTFDAGTINILYEG
jgi:hypothetical protein